MKPYLLLICILSFSTIIHSAEKQEDNKNENGKIRVVYNVSEKTALVCFDSLGQKAAINDLALAGINLSQPPSLLQFSNLTELNVMNNNLRTLGWVKEVPHLKSLMASYNNIQHIRPLFCLKKLEHLHLAQNKIQKVPLALVGHLKELDLRFNPLTNQTIEKLIAYLACLKTTIERLEMMKHLLEIKTKI